MGENLRSKQLVSIVEVLSEGEIGGLVNGYRSIYLDNTPIRGITSGKNFENITVDQRTGRPHQSVMAQFGRTEKEISVGTELKHGIPLTRTITDPKVNRVRLTLGVSALFKQEEDGSNSPQSVDFKITVGDRVEYLTITGKHTAQYLRNLTLSYLPPVPFSIKVERVQENSDSLRLQNNTLWSAYTEITDTAFTYPHTALIGIKFDSRYFANIPTRTYDVLGIKVKVPSNYDPIRRTYTGLWDGTFKIAWTNNPAWILYDLVTSKRYGLGQRLGEFGADKWALYQVAQYCDQLIPNGFGGKEPRFTCNVWLTEQRSAYDVINDICSIFRAMPVWNGTELTVIMDRPADPVWTYTAANVIGGFSRQYSAMKARHNAVQVEYLDADNNYEKAIEYVSDDEAIRKYGLNLKKVTAFGCTSRGQAHRTGLWILMTEKLETETITFTVGSEGLMHIPGDIIRVADTQYAGANIGGRVLAMNGRTLTLDREISLSGNSYFQYINAEAKPTNIKISRANGNTVTLDRVPAGLSVNGVWSLTTQQITSQLYRAMTISENEDGSYTIMALQHEPQKEAIVDNGAVFEPRNTTLHRTPHLEHLDVQLDAGSVKFAWQTSSGIGTLTYDVRIFKGGKLYAYHRGLTSLELALEDLPDGEYEVVIQAKNAQGQVVSEKSQTFVINRPPVPEDVVISGGLTDVTLLWKWWDDATQTEIWASETDDILTATRVAKVLASTYTHNVGPRQTRYYWLRHTRGQNKGLFYQEQGLKAETAVDIDEELRVLNEKLSENIVDKVFDVAAPARQLSLVKTVEHLPSEFNGHHTLYNLADNKQYQWNGTAYVGLINETTTIPTSQLEQSLVQQLNQNSRAIEQEGRNRQSAIQTAVASETSNRTKALQAESQARINTIRAESAKLTQSLQTETRARGTAITRLENVDKQQAGQISQVSAKADQALTGVSEERNARIAGDNAEAQARNALTARVTSAESGITQLQRSVANQTTALSEVSQTLSVRLDNLHVGGRNYLRNSLDFSRYWRFGQHTNETGRIFRENNEIIIDSQTENYSAVIQIAREGTHSNQENCSETLKDLPSAIYTVSFEAKATTNGAIRVLLRQKLLPSGVKDAYKYITIDSQDWKKYTLQLNYHKANNLDYVQFEFTCYLVGAEIRLRKVKLERGTIATDWTPAPEDTDSDIAKVFANLTAYQQTQATKEAATAQQLTQLNGRIGQTESGLSDLRRTVSNATSATAEQIQTLSASLNNLSVGGRNLLKGSAVPYSASGYSTRYVLTAAPKVGEDVVITLWGNLGEGRTGIGVYNSQGYNEVARLVKIADGVYQGKGKWKKPIDGDTERTPNDTHLNVYFYPRTATSTNEIRQIKLEKGTVGTDWTPAPEDTDTALTGIRAEISSASRTVADLSNKVSATHTIKSQAIAGGRTAIAGIALGATADNRTAESSVIVMADRFGVVKNAQDGTVKPMFNVVNNKVAIHGDLVADGSITATKLAANSVTAGALQAGAVRTEHLATGQVSADKLAIGLGGNLLVNPTFLPDKDGRPFGWNEYAGGWHNGSFQLGQGGEWLGGNIDTKFERCLNWDRTTPNGYTGWAVCIAQDINVLPGKRYIFSFYGSLHSGSMQVNAEKIDHTGRYLATLPAISRHQTHEGAGNMRNGLANATRFSVTFVAPDTGRVRLIAGDMGQGRRCLIMMRAMLEEVPDTITLPSPWKPGGITMIDGGQIATNSITAQQIGAGAITANHLTAGAIAARHISANSINASQHIQARSIGADKLSIQSLSAVSANLGTVTSGRIEGTTIHGNTITGGTISGTTIKSAHIESATGRFSGELEVTQLVGGNVYEVVESMLQRTGRKKTYTFKTSYSTTSKGTLYEYRATIHLFSAKSQRLLNIEGYSIGAHGMKVPAYQFVNSGNDMFNQTNLDNGVYYDNEKQREFFVNSSIGHITGGILIIPPNVKGRVTIGYWGNGNGESFGIKATATVMSNVALINIGI